MNPPQPTTVSLVLGAGGARGFAHIGVLQWLAENGYCVRSIAGSSMGALIGGIYATGKLQVYADWALALERRDVVRLLDPAFERDGLFKGERIMDVLRQLIGDGDIKDLPMPFTAVAMDLDSGKEVWLRNGKLFDAIRASIAIPLLLTPFGYGNRRLVDGGLINPVPLAPTLNDATDITVAVNLGGRPEVFTRPQPGAPAGNGSAYRQRIGAFIENLLRSEPVTTPAPRLLDAGLRSMEAMQDTIGRLKLAAAYPPDVMIEIPRNACRIHEFWRAEELIALGRERAARAFAAADLYSERLR